MSASSTPPPGADPTPMELQAIDVASTFLEVELHRIETLFRRCAQALRSPAGPSAIPHGPHWEAPLRRLSDELHLMRRELDSLCASADKLAAQCWCLAAAALAARRPPGAASARLSQALDRLLDAKARLAALQQEALHCIAQADRLCGRAPPAVPPSAPPPSPPLAPPVEPPISAEASALADRLLAGLRLRR